MSDRRASARRPWLTAGLTTVALAALLGVVLLWLRATAPVVSAPPVELGDGSDILSCGLLTAEGALVPTGVDRATSDQVLRCPVSFEGRTVRYVGEVVGDVLDRGEGSWLLVNDDAYALSSGPLGASGEFAGGNTGLTVWLPDPLDELELTPGRGDRRGHVVELMGQVRRDDPLDGGGLTLRATSIDVLAEPVELDTPVHREQAVVAVVMTVLAGGVLWVERRGPGA